MRTIIAGGRDIVDFRPVLKAIRRAYDQKGIRVDTLICGMAPGVDETGYWYAKMARIPILEFPVTREEWDRLGKKAGIMRNQRMADAADALIAVWDGVSHGTGNMIAEMEERGLPVYVERIE